MGPAKAIGREDRVALGGEIAVGIEQKLDALMQLVVAQEKRVGPGF